MIDSDLMEEVLKGEWEMRDDDLWHRQQYLDALTTAGVDGPAWENLTDEQRENIRAINYQHRDWMELMGKALATGAQLPPLPR